MVKEGLDPASVPVPQHDNGAEELFASVVIPPATAKAAVELIEIDLDDVDDGLAVLSSRPAQNVCASCTFVNSPTALVCAICDSALPQQQQRRESTAPPASASSSSSSNWAACQACTFLNPQTALVCQTCDKPLVDARAGAAAAGGGDVNGKSGRACNRCSVILPENHPEKTACTCLLYTSDAADE